MDTEIYPHPESQYNVRPNVKRGIVMISMDKWSAGANKW